MIGAKTTVLLVEPNDCLKFYQLNIHDQSSNLPKYKIREVITLNSVFKSKQSGSCVIFQICAENMSIEFEQNATNFAFYAKTKATRNEIKSNLRRSPKFVNTPIKIRLAEDILCLTGKGMYGSVFGELF